MWWRLKRWLACAHEDKNRESLRYYTIYIHRICCGKRLKIHISFDEKDDTDNEWAATVIRKKKKRATRFIWKTDPGLTETFLYIIVSVPANWLVHGLPTADATKTIFSSYPIVRTTHMLSMSCWCNGNETQSRPWQWQCLHSTNMDVVDRMLWPRQHSQHTVETIDTLRIAILPHWHPESLAIYIPSEHVFHYHTHEPQTINIAMPFFFFSYSFTTMNEKPHRMRAKRIKIIRQSVCVIIRCEIFSLNVQSWHFRKWSSSHSSECSQDASPIECNHDAQSAAVWTEW